MSRLVASIAFGRLAGCRGVAGGMVGGGRVLGGVRTAAYVQDDDEWKENSGEYDESRLDGAMPVTMDDEDRTIASSHFQQTAPVFKEYVYTVAQHHQHEPAAEDIADWLDHCGPKDKYKDWRPYQDEERVIVLPPKKFTKQALDQEEEIGKRRRVMDMIIQGYDKRMVEAAERVALAARMLPNTKVTGLSPMRSQMKKWAIISGPFKFSKGKEHYGIFRHRRRLIVDTDRKTSEQFYAYLRVNLSPLISIRCRTHDYVPLKDYLGFDQHLEDVGRGERA